MKIRIIVLAAAFIALAQLSYAASAVGTIGYLEGQVSIVRGGRTLPQPQIGDAVENYDLIHTGKDGKAEIAVGTPTGMTGSVKIEPATIFQIKVETVNAEAKSTLELMTGSVAVKVKKAAGKPTMTVRTETASLGVRGTSFGIVSTIQGDVLVTCDEGDVAVSDGSASAEAVPGTAVTRLSDSPLASVPVALSSLEDFRNGWIAERIEAFRANAYPVTRDYAGRYAKMSIEFSRAMDDLAQSPALIKWIREDRNGVKPRANDPAVMKEKTEVVNLLFAVRKNLFIFERVYYRILELADIAPREIMGEKISGYGTVRGFLAQVDREKNALASRMALFHYAEVLFADRNGGSSGGLLDGGSSGDFFDSAKSQDDFFNN